MTKTTTKPSTALIQWDNTYAPYPNHLSLIHIFGNIVSENPDKEAILFNDKTLTHK